MLLASMCSLEIGRGSVTILRGTCKHFFPTKSGQSTPGLTKPQVDEAHGWTGHFVYSVYSVYSRSHHIPSTDLANLAKFSLRTNCWLLSLPDFHAQMVKVAQLFGHVWMPSFAHHGLLSGRVDASSRSYVSTALSKFSSLAKCWEDRKTWGNCLGSCSICNCCFRGSEHWQASGPGKWVQENLEPYSLEDEKYWKMLKPPLLLALSNFQGYWQPFCPGSAAWHTHSCTKCLWRPHLCEWKGPDTTGLQVTRLKASHILGSLIWRSHCWVVSGEALQQCQLICKVLARFWICAHLGSLCTGLPLPKKTCRSQTIL